MEHLYTNQSILENTYLLIKRKSYQFCRQGRIQTISTYANAEVTTAVVKLLKNTRIPIFSTKLFSSFLLPIEKIRRS